MNFLEKQAWKTVNVFAGVGFNELYKKAVKVQRNIEVKRAGLMDKIELKKLRGIFELSQAKIGSLKKNRPLTNLELQDLGKFKRVLFLIDKTNYVVELKQWKEFDKPEWEWFCHELLETAQLRKKAGSEKDLK